jgi:hypothetical protein
VFGRLPRSVAADDATAAFLSDANPAGWIPSVSALPQSALFKALYLAILLCPSRLGTVFSSSMLGTWER